MNLQSAVLCNSWLRCVIRPCDRLFPSSASEANATNEKAKRMLGWEPRSDEEAIVATAESLVRLGLVMDDPKKTPQKSLKSSHSVNN